MYESPISIYLSGIKTEMMKAQEEYVVSCVQRTGVNVNKEELIKALEYDRDQYRKGYSDAMLEIQKPMSAEEFEQEMKEVYERNCGDPEDFHIEADALMMKLLTSLGYGDGVRFFDSKEKLYS